MTYRGRVENGVIVFDGPDRPPEGAEVSVRVLKGRKRGKRGPSPLYQRLKPILGMADGPPDASVNLDHYLYGLDKRE